MMTSQKCMLLQVSNIQHPTSKVPNQGSLIRSRAKKLQEQVNSFLTDCAFKTSKDVILPNCSTLVVLRCTYEENDQTTKRNNHNS